MFFRLFEKDNKNGYYKLKETIVSSASKMHDYDKVMFVLHGWGAESQTYKSMFLDLLESVDAIVAIDFPGFGNEKIYRSFTLDDYADYLQSIIKLFCAKHIFFLCHSFGARVFFVFYKKYFECYSNMSKLILMAPAGIKPRFSLIRFLKVKKYKHFAKKCKNNPKLCEKLSKYGSNDYKNIKSDILKNTFKNVVGVDASGFAACVKLPTIIIWGTGDYDVKRHMVIKLNKLIAGSKLYIIKHAGHFPFLFDKAGVISIIKNFLM